jgi:membrane associated rhomboid family serine protease
MTAPDQESQPPLGGASGVSPGARREADEPGDAGRPPTCFRHPGRETYVSCVRCGRPACPDCLRSAAVGQQCVECVREGHRTSRPVAAAFGGRPSRSAIVTWSLIAVNVVIFLAEVSKPSLLYDWGMYGRAVADGQWYRLLTSAFTAPGTSFGGWGLLDIAFNMWALYFVGPELERLLGPMRYLAVYLLSAIGGAVLFYYLAPDALAAGASGAVFGLFGAWFVVTRRLRLDTRGIVMLIAINLIFSFTVRNIAWQDHLGGLIVGAALTAAYAYAPRKNRAAIQLAATIAVVVILVVAVIIRNGQLS